MELTPGTDVAVQKMGDLEMTPNDRKAELAMKLTSRLVALMRGEQPAFLKDCEFRPIQSIEEFRACSRLVYLEYLQKKYTNPNQGQLRLILHQMSENSTTFIALLKKRFVLSTMTLVEDSPLGVPMDKIYQPELDILRNKGRHFIETTMLAENSQILNDPSVSKSGRLLVLLNLLKGGFIYLKKHTQVNSVVACFHPRHELFYQAIQFKPLGELKKYESVQDSPAVGYGLDLDMDYSGDPAVMAMREFFGLTTPHQNSPQEPYQKVKFKLSDIGNMFIAASEQV